MKVTSYWDCTDNQIALSIRVRDHSFVRLKTKTESGNLSPTYLR